jgi:anti-sigma factor RsiW
VSTRPITEDDLHAYVDAVLDPARQAEVAAYLEAHPEFAARVQGYIRQRDDMVAALAPIAEEPVPAELNLARLIEARRRPRANWWRAAAAAVLLFGCGGAGGWALRGVAAPAPASAGIAALAQEAADSYAVYAPDHLRPVEIRAAERAELVDWASQRLNHRVAVPDLSASGYRFMGGRLVPTAHGPAVMFMYDDDHGTRLVMLARPMAIERNTPMSQHRQAGVTGFAWADQGIGYTLVGPTAPDVLHLLANEVRRQIDQEV